MGTYSGNVAAHGYGGEWTHRSGISHLSETAEDPLDHAQLCILFRIRFSIVATHSHSCLEGFRRGLNTTQVILLSATSYTAGSVKIQGLNVDDQRLQNFSGPISPHTHISGQLQTRGRAKADCALEREGVPYN